LNAELAQAEERVLFEARVSPRKVLVALWMALALGPIVSVAMSGPHLLIFYAVAPLLLALKELNRVALRVTSSAIIHQQPGWMAGITTLATARSGLQIGARDVAGIEWAGHDNIGIRMKDGRVETVCFTHRIGTANRALARRAILDFVERATGRAEPQAREVAPWVVHQPS
jgi:hypothetical protein